MNSYLLKKAAVSLLSLALAAALVVLTFSVQLMAFFSSEGRITGSINRHSAEVIAMIDEAVAPAAQRFDLPEDALSGAIDGANFNIISGVITHNMMKGYVTDFSENTDLFNAYMTKLKAYETQAGKKISDNHKIEIASYAVNLASNALATSETGSVSLFSYIKGRMMLLMIAGSVVVILFSVFLIDMLTRGKHRKFSYYGMSIITAGYVDIGLPLWMKYKGYLGKMQFISIAPYNNAITENLAQILKYAVIVGAVFFVAGFVILLVNYNYFRKKNAEIEASREKNDEISGDYMPVENTASTHIPGEEFEKEVMKIDFD